VTGDTNSRSDVFIRDLVAGTNSRYSIADGGTQGNDTSQDPWLTADGKTVAFQSVATNLVTGDTNAASDIFVRGPGLDATTYGYDRLYRLTSVSGPDGSPTYTYDPVGNRTSKVLGGTTASTYDRADRILTFGAINVTVNANGNTTARGGDTFTFDQPNRLKTATVAGATETYVYDGDGTRFSRQVGAGTPIRFVSDVNRGLPVTIDDGTHKYVYGLGLAYAISGSTVEVYHTDRLGSVRAITDATGAVTSTYRTDEWGVLTSTTGASTQLFRYAGEPRDATGLTYLRTRYYDPSIGRFLTRDVKPGRTATPQSQDRFSYAQNDPTTLTDPRGTDPKSANGDCGFLGLGCSTPCHMQTDPYGQRLVCPQPGVNNPLPGGGTMPGGGGLPGDFPGPAAGLGLSDWAQQVAEHALANHFWDLPPDLRDPESLANYIFNLISTDSYSESKTGPGGRVAYWDDNTGMIIFFDPDKPPGSAFEPPRGKSYFDDWPDVGP
jgi:RHS repeat-associated protein